MKKLKQVLSNKNTVTIIAAILIVLVLYFFYNWRVSQATSPIRVPYATQTIPPRTQITDDMIGYVEKLIESIENQESDQLFIAKARVFKFKVDYLKKLYEGKSESYYASYKQLQRTGAHTDAIATLRQEAVIYKKYLAYQTTGSVYNPANIAQQLEYLLAELQDTLMILKDER